MDPESYKFSFPLLQKIRIERKRSVQSTIASSLTHHFQYSGQRTKTHAVNTLFFAYRKLAEQHRMAVSRSAFTLDRFPLRLYAAVLRSLPGAMRGSLWLRSPHTTTSSTSMTPKTIPFLYPVGNCFLVHHRLQ